jgi:amino acid transporter
MSMPVAVSPSVSRLRKEIGGVQFFTLAFGAVVGVGWAVVLGDWLRQAGPIGAVLGLAAGGFIVVLIGLCYAEVTALIPASGGEVAFAYEVFGDRACFATGWLLSFTYIVVCSFEAISIGWIVTALAPSLQGPVIYTSLGSEVRAGTLALGLGGMLVLSVLNYRGAKSATRVQDVLITTLLVMATAFLLAGFLRGDPANLLPYFQRSASGSIWPGVLALFMTASFWFGGFNTVPTVMEEKSAGTSLYRVGVILVLSIVVGIVFKTAVVLSASMTMPWQRLMTMNIPAAAAFREALGSNVLGNVVLLTALFGLLSTWNAMIVCASRILFSIGRAGFISPRFGNVHPVFGSPATAVVFTGVLGAFGTLLGRNALIPIVNASATCLTFCYALTCLAMIRLRRKAPDKQRPFRAPGGLVTAWIAIAGAALSLGLSLYQPYVDAKGRVPLEWVLLAMWLALGALFWFGAARMRARIGAQERRAMIMGGYAAAE